jgi:hypothetical protein
MDKLALLLDAVLFWVSQVIIIIIIIIIYELFIFNINITILCNKINYIIINI